MILAALVGFCKFPFMEAKWIILAFRSSNAQNGNKCHFRGY